MKKLIRRGLADTDILAMQENYVANAPEYALSFLDTLEHTYQYIQNFTATGFPRYAHELDLPDLRVWSCNKFSYLVFYAEHHNQIKVWRVLHSSRDIQTSLQFKIFNNEY